MCDGYSAVAAIVAAGIAAGGTAYAAQTQSNQQKYQSQVAKNNAKSAEFMAIDAINRGQIAEDAHRKKVNQIIGAQRAALAGQGTDISSGSPLDILTDTASAGSLDSLMIRSNAAREAFGFRSQGMNFMAQSNLLSTSASNTMTAGYIGAGQSLLSSAGSVGDQWSTYRGDTSMWRNPDTGQYMRSRAF